MHYIKAGSGWSFTTALYFCFVTLSGSSTEIILVAAVTLVVVVVVVVVVLLLLLLLILLLLLLLLRLQIATTMIAILVVRVIGCGFSNVMPRSLAAKAFTQVYIVVGLGMVASLMSVLVEIIILRVLQTFQQPNKDIEHNILLYMI